MTTYTQSDFMKSPLYNEYKQYLSPDMSLIYKEIGYNYSYNPTDCWTDRCDLDLYNYVKPTLINTGKAYIKLAQRDNFMKKLVSGTLDRSFYIGEKFDLDEYHEYYGSTISQNYSNFCHYLLDEYNVSNGDWDYAPRCLKHVLNNVPPEAFKQMKTNKIFLEYLKQNKDYDFHTVLIDKFWEPYNDLKNNLDFLSQYSLHAILLLWLVVFIGFKISFFSRLKAYFINIKNSLSKN